MKWERGGLCWNSEKFHPRLFWCSTTLLVVTRVATRDDITPLGLPPIPTRYHVVIVEFRQTFSVPTVLALEVIPSVDVDPRELDTLLYGGKGVL